MISIDRFGRASVIDMRSNNGAGMGNGRTYPDDRSIDRDRDYNDRDFNDRDYNDRDLDDRDNRSFDENKDWNKGNDFEFDRDGRAGDYDGRDGRDNRDNRDFNGSYSRAMSDIDFSRVMQSIQKEWFDNNKEKSASQIISTNFFTASQVKQLLQLFTFEENKLTLAKQAYGKTVDQQNYYIINDVFSYSSSKDELARYIRSSR
jgi:hypothetical protein